jgi:hypothetical protein
MEHKNMKHAVLWILLAVLTFPAAAQKKQKTQTAMEGVIHSVSSYSEALVKYGDFNGEFAWLFGGRVGVLLNESTGIGAAYYTKVDRSVKADFRVGDESPYLSFHYGGLDMEYVIATHELFHFTIQALFGIGSYSYCDPEELIEFENKFFWILEPGVNFELNMTEWLRLQWGVHFRILFDDEENPDNITYRFGRQVFDYGVSSGDLSNIGFQFGVKFGGF